MRILTIGDPHGNVEKLKGIPKKEIDLILVTGDLAKVDLARKRAFENVERRKRGEKELKQTAESVTELHREGYSSSMEVMRYLASVAPTYTIFGNAEPSDKETKKDNKKYGLSLPFFTADLNLVPNVKVINDVVVEEQGVRIGGLEYFVDVNWVEDFKPSDFDKRLRKARVQTVRAGKILSKFGHVDILVCHQPPYGVLDQVNFPSAPKHWQGKNAGSKIILDYIKRFQPRYVFCGHIHEGEGMATIGKTEVYNLGVCGYKIIEL